MLKATVNVDFESGSTKLIDLPVQRWTELPFDPERLDGGRLLVPPDQFAWRNRVRDEALTLIDDGGLLRLSAGNLLEAAEDAPIAGVVMVLESPHKSEYKIAADGTLVPKWPLAGSRHLFVEHIEEVLRGIDLAVPGTSLILSNPVPYQCSLARLFPRRLKLQANVRNDVWRTLFEGGFREAFQARVSSYRPVAVLNACTSDLKVMVRAALCEVRSRADFALWECNHPSGWFAGRTLCFVPKSPAKESSGFSV